MPLPPWLANIIEEASLSEDDDLLSLWTNLITNGLDPNFQNRIERSYVSILADFNPTDAHCFRSIYLTVKQQGKRQVPSTVQYTLESVLRAVNSQGVRVDYQDIEISLRNLLRLGLIRPGIQQVEGIFLGGISPERYLDIEAFRPTFLGIRLFDAVA